MRYPTSVREQLQSLDKTRATVRALVPTVQFADQMVHLFRREFPEAKVCILASLSGWASCEIKFPVVRVGNAVPLLRYLRVCAWKRLSKEPEQEIWSNGVRYRYTLRDLKGEMRSLSILLVLPKKKEDLSPGEALAEGCRYEIVGYRQEPVYKLVCPEDREKAVSPGFGQDKDGRVLKGRVTVAAAAEEIPF